MTVAPARALVGNRYALGPVLGRGGMADVHRATDTVLGREVAVKLFKPAVGAGVEDVDRTSSEVQLLASLDHPGLVSLYDAGTSDDGSPWLVMQLVDGPTLRECCVDGSLTPERVAQVGADLAAALAHCHERGVIHRDVKPANVLIGPDGRARLADFGIARLVDGARHTATGLTVGTAPYFSPEQVRGGVVGPPTDVYALGLVLLESLTGKRVYADTDPVACAVARLHRAPVVPGTLAAGDAGRAWAWLLTRMTADDPDERPTAAEAATELDELAGRAPTAVLADAAVPADATRVLDVPPLPDALTPDGPDAAPDAALDDPATVSVPRSIRDTLPPRPVRSGGPELPRWIVAAREHLVDDPVGRLLAAALLVVLLCVVAVAAWASAGSDGSGATTPGADLTPIERLEESVQR